MDITTLKGKVKVVEITVELDDGRVLLWIGDRAEDVWAGIMSDAELQKMAGTEQAKPTVIHPPVTAPL